MRKRVQRMAAALVLMLATMALSIVGVLVLDAVTSRNDPKTPARIFRTGAVRVVEQREPFYAAGKKD